MHSVRPICRRTRRGVARVSCALLLLIAAPQLARAQSDNAATGPTADDNAIAAPALDDAGNPAPSAPAQPGPNPLRPMRGGVFHEPAFIGKWITWGDDTFGGGKTSPKDGFYPELSNMITGAGMVSVGPGYQRHVLNDNAFFNVSGALSWHLYKVVQGRFEFPELGNGHLTLGTQAMWQDATQIDYFGVGPDTQAFEQTQYRLKSTDWVGYSIVRAKPWLIFDLDFGWLSNVEVLPAGGSFNPDFPDARVVFRNDPAMTLANQPSFLHAQASITVDTRDYRNHPTHGYLLRAAATTFDDQDTGTFTFTQYEGEAAAFVPLGTTRFVLATHLWTLWTDVAAGHQVPFYLMASNGGNNTIRSFSDYRFHDQSSLLASAELRVALMTHMDAAGFVDAGNVGATFGDLNLDHTSVGAGLRMHNGRTTFARLDAAYGSEGWELIVRTTEVYKIVRLTRSIATIPFFP